MRYTSADVGCHADGLHGHQHCRFRLSELLFVDGDLMLQVGDFTEAEAEEINQRHKRMLTGENDA